MHAKSLLSALLVLVLVAPAWSTDAVTTRAAFLKIIDRPVVPLAPQVEAMPAAGGTLKYHFTFAADAEQRVPGLLLKPAAATGRRPVVIVLHGIGGTKEGTLDYVTKLVNAGFIGVSIDGRYHGERTTAKSGASEYNAAIVRAWQTGKEHPFYYDTAWDVMRLIDYLHTRDDVDPARIGVMGISKVDAVFKSGDRDAAICLNGVENTGIVDLLGVLRDDDWDPDTRFLGVRLASGAVFSPIPTDPRLL